MQRSYSARLFIKLGPLAKDYFAILDKPKRYKRSEIMIRKGSNSISIKVEAEDATALIASLGSIIKQLNIIRSVDSLVQDAKSNAKANAKRTS
ncbi:MAG: KEOPS complex subunit Pcc1 [Candidatus Micrarchaeia archaeon]